MDAASHGDWPVERLADVSRSRLRTLRGRSKEAFWPARAKASAHQLDEVPPLVCQRGAPARPQDRGFGEAARPAIDRPGNRSTPMNKSRSPASAASTPISATRSGNALEDDRSAGAAPLTGGIRGAPTALRGRPIRMPVFSNAVPPLRDRAGFRCNRARRQQDGASPSRRPSPPTPGAAARAPAAILRRLLLTPPANARLRPAPPPADLTRASRRR